MREILFRYRFKNIDTGEISDPEIYPISSIEKSELDWIGLPNQKLQVFKREQYTGLIDKYANKIFEGDILLSCYPTTKYVYDKEVKYYKRVVYFQDGCFRYYEGDKHTSWAMVDYGWVSNNHEVIGNTTDNVYLMEDNDV